MQKALIATTVASVILILAGSSNASDADTSRFNAVCDGKFGLCRYVDRQTRREVIPARFEQAMPFSEGLAPVSIGGRYGYIDGRGDTVIAPRFDLAGHFYQGLAEVLVGNKAGVINRKGEFVVEPKFKRAIPFTSQTIIAADGEWMPKFGNPPQMMPPSSDVDAGSFGIYHVGGYWVRNPDITRIRVFEREGRGLIWAATAASHRPFGLLASDGTWRVEQQYDIVEPLDGDRAFVRKNFGADSLYGLVDEVGEIAMPMRHWNTFQRSRGWTWAREKLGERYAVFNSRGETIRLVDGLLPETPDAAIVNIDGRWIGMDRAGNVVPNPRNGRELARCPSGIREIEFEGKVRFMDAKREPTTPYLFDSNYILSCEEPLQVRLGDKWDFVGTDGRLLNDPPAFDEVRSFSGGYAGVKLNGKWGVIDTNGRMILPAKFDAYLGSRKGLFHIELAGKRTWLTASEEPRAEPPPEMTQTPAASLDCGHGLRLTERNGKWGIVDTIENKEVLAPVYRAVNCFRNGLAWVPIDSRREWCAVDRQGEVRQSVRCLPTYYPSYPTHTSPQKFDEDPFENSVLWARAFLEFSTGLRADQPVWIPWKDGPSTVFR